MSYTIMPALPMSMAKGLRKAPAFNTAVQEVAAARGNAAAGLKPYCTWEFEFDLDKISGNEAAAATVIAQFLGTYMACYGRNKLFLFTDPQDFAVTHASGSGMLAFKPTGPSAVGDGTSTQFQLARLIGGAGWDIVQNLNGAIQIKVGGVVVVPASISPTGLVTFTTPPINGATLTWQGSFYFLCRFDEDTQDMTRVFTMNNGTDLWDISSVKFSSEFV